MSLNKRLIVIQGPTACGKTALSIQLAEHFNSEIISADSRQFYKEMEIGTAKPSSLELEAVPHHFINSDSIHHLVNASEYEKRGMELLLNLFDQHNTLILVGGSGMFVDALVDGLDPVPTDEVVREQLNKQFENQGLTSLVQELVSLDESAEETIDLKNPMRVIRALEVVKITGKPFSSFKNLQPQKRPFDTYRFAIDLPREILYERINKRIDVMLDNGLWKEIELLYPYKELKTLQTVGYQEFFEHLDGKYSFHEAVELVKRNSRRYAKRQLTWLRKTKELHWLEGQNIEEQRIEILKKLQ
jgi:tRNA dimethylallyltransferase